MLHSSVMGILTSRIVFLSDNVSLVDVTTVSSRVSNLLPPNAFVAFSRIRWMTRVVLSGGINEIGFGKAVMMLVSFGSRSLIEI